MFGIGGTELAIILLFAFLIVGPEKLPSIGRTVGRAIRQFRNASDEVNRVIRTEVYDPIMDNKPMRDPSEILSGKKKTEPARTVKTVDDAGTETFAERRARLARERAEKAAAAPVEQAAATEAQAAPEPAPAAAPEPAPTVETFAERRARLEKERAARAAAKEQQAATAAAEAAPAASLADALYADVATTSGEGGDAAGVE